MKKNIHNKIGEVTCKKCKFVKRDLMSYFEGTFWKCYYGGKYRIDYNPVTGRNTKSRNGWCYCADRNEFGDCPYFEKKQKKLLFLFIKDKVLQFSHYILQFVNHVLKKG